MGRRLLWIFCRHPQVVAGFVHRISIAHCISCNAKELVHLENMGICFGASIFIISQSSFQRSSRTGVPAPSSGPARCTRSGARCAALGRGASQQPPPRRGSQRCGSESEQAELCGDREGDHSWSSRIARISTSSCASCLSRPSSPRLCR